MTDGVAAPMDRVERTSCNEPVDRGIAQAECA
jgi:hypothetical protein